MSEAQHEARAIRRRRYYTAKQAYLRKIKEDSPCADCGVRYPYWVMEFDHLPGKEKLYPPTKLDRRSWPSLLTEIGKCEVVCANCHRNRTYSRTMATLHGGIREYELSDLPVTEDRRRGEFNNNVKLTDAQVAEIRKSYTGARGEIKSMAESYGVNRTTISRIIHGRRRKGT
ncbi:hypothetical protein [Saccharopolyspora shandongensis]|uniref:hypothetical protein n=1 Tax=Saccharopolyspora shandongensis TaxID=418495 RepID=UPI0033D8FEBA